MVQWLKKLVRGRDRFNASIANGRIPATRIRALAESDVESCCEIYAQNEREHFPDGYRDLFRSSLVSPSYLYLVIESDHRVVAVGGVTRELPRQHTCVLAFGMVHPKLQRRGFGSALLLARLAALPPPDPWDRIVLTTAGKSASFYSRFGFTYSGREHVQPYGHAFDAHYAILRKSDWVACSDVLTASSVTFERDKTVVPIGAASHPNGL